MAVFEYQAFDNKGARTKGVIDADSAQEARAKLRQLGLHLTSLKESRPSISPSEVPFARTLKRVRMRDLAPLIRQLATLLGAGLPLTEALSGVSEQLENQSLKKTLIDVRERVKGGVSLSSALSQHSRVFPPLFISMVKAGESAGALELVLERLADHSEKQLLLQNKLRSALAYPAFVLTIGLLILILLFTFLIPRVTVMFTVFQAALPRPTLILIGLGNFFKEYWWLLVLFILFFTFGIERYIKTKKGKIVYDSIKLRMPLLGSLNQRIALTRFSRTLATLLAGGVPLLTALGIVENIVNNRVLAKAIKEAAESVRRGESLASPLARSHLFPPLVVRMIASGEKSGKMEELLSKVADTYDGEVSTRITTLTSLIEPILILILGLMVGFIVLAILLPIFQMSQAIH